MFFPRGPGADFSEADRALLTLLRPHLYDAYIDAERRRHPVAELTARQWQLLDQLAAGHTNAQIARRLGLSEGTVRKHLENIYSRLGVLQPHRRGRPCLPGPGVAARNPGQVVAAPRLSARCVCRGQSAHRDRRDGRIPGCPAIADRN